MNVRRFLIFLLLLCFISCREDDIKVSSGNDQQSAPSWAEGFPSIRAGATTADLEIETRTDAKVHYVVSDKKLSLTPEEVVTQASNPSSSDIRYYGVLDARGGERIVQPMEKLGQKKNYHVYFLSNGNDGAGVQELSFTTHVRQDTVQYHSEVEDRQVDYLLFKPEEAHKYGNKKFPAIFFLGGYGEVSNSKKKINLIQNGLLPEYIYKGNDVPMIVMSVQHVNKDWSNELINEAMDHAFRTMPIDRNKVYLVGTSGGAFGVWNYAEAFPEKLAAIIPISGGGNADRACQLRTVAVWAFSNKSDHIVNPGKTTEMIDAVKHCTPAKEVRMDVLPDAGHNCWRRVFDKNHPDWSKSPNVKRFDIYEWLLRQSRTGG
jgi:dienelactone hydrolase